MKVTLSNQLSKTFWAILQILIFLYLGRYTTTASLDVQYFHV